MIRYISIVYDNDSLTKGLEAVLKKNNIGTAPAVSLWYHSKGEEEDIQKKCRVLSKLDPKELYIFVTLPGGHPIRLYICKEGRVYEIDCEWYDALDFDDAHPSPISDKCRTAGILDTVLGILNEHDHDPFSLKGLIKGDFNEITEMD